MFIQVTPINEITGQPTGNPVFLNQEAVLFAQRVSANADHVDYTRVAITSENEALIISETPQEMFPSMFGALRRD